MYSSYNPRRDHQPTASSQTQQPTATPSHEPLEGLNNATPTEWLKYWIYTVLTKENADMVSSFNRIHGAWAGIQRYSSHPMYHFGYRESWEYPFMLVGLNLSAEQRDLIDWVYEVIFGHASAPDNFTRVMEILGHGKNAKRTHEESGVLAMFLMAGDSFSAEATKLMRGELKSWARKECLSKGKNQDVAWKFLEGVRGFRGYRKPDTAGPDERRELKARRWSSVHQDQNKISITRGKPRDPAAFDPVPQYVEQLTGLSGSSTRNARHIEEDSIAKLQVLKDVSVLRQTVMEARAVSEALALELEKFKSSRIQWPAYAAKLQEETSAAIDKGEAFIRDVEARAFTSEYIKESDHLDAPRFSPIILPIMASPSFANLKIMVQKPEEGLRMAGALFDGGFTSFTAGEDKACWVVLYWACQVINGQQRPRGLENANSIALAKKILSEGWEGRKEVVGLLGDWVKDTLSNYAAALDPPDEFEYEIGDDDAWTTTDCNTTADGGNEEEQQESEDESAWTGTTDGNTTRYPEDKDEQQESHNVYHLFGDIVIVSEFPLDESQIASIKGELKGKNKEITTLSGKAITPLSDEDISKHTNWAREILSKRMSEKAPNLFDQLRDKQLARHILTKNRAISEAEYEEMRSKIAVFDLDQDLIDDSRKHETGLIDSAKKTVESGKLDEDDQKIISAHTVLAAAGLNVHEGVAGLEVSGEEWTPSEMDQDEDHPWDDEVVDDEKNSDIEGEIGSILDLANELAGQMAMATQNIQVQSALEPTTSSAESTINEDIENKTDVAETTTEIKTMRVHNNDTSSEQPPASCDDVTSNRSSPPPASCEDAEDDDDDSQESWPLVTSHDEAAKVEG
jgi:hypothetical protein